MTARTCVRNDHKADLKIGSLLWYADFARKGDKQAVSDLNSMGFWVFGLLGGNTNRRWPLETFIRCGC